VDDITTINGRLLIEHESIFMKSLKTYCAQLITLLCLAPFVANADVGIVAIAVDANLQDKGAFETNAGINEGDIISTGKNGSLTILFDDESMLTLGPNTKAKIVKFSETPAPGVSEIKIINGSFNYFPGTILENGGQQLLTNLADAGKNNVSGSDRDKIDAPNRSSENHSPSAISSRINENDDKSLAATNPGTSLANINTADLSSTITVAKPVINLVVASSGATDGSNGGNTSVSGAESEPAAIAAPALVIILDPAYHIETSHEGPHLKAGTANGHVPHS